MTLLAMEGFEHGDIVMLDGQNSLSDSEMSTTYGRLGGKGCRLWSTIQRLDFNLTIETYSTVTMGVAIRPSGTWLGNSTLYDSYKLISFFDENGNATAGISTVDSLYNVRPFIKQQGSYVGDYFKIDNLIFNYLEIQVVLHSTNGSITVKKNGIVMTSVTGVNTIYSGGDFINYVRIYNNNCTAYYDDIYVTDGEFLGDVRIRGFVPDSNGSTNDFTPSVGSNYQCVDETPSTDDTDYVESDIQGDIDLYGITTGTLADVKAIKLLNQVKKTDAGTREVRPIVRSNGSNYNGDTVSLSTEYSNKCKQIWETDPDDSNAWNQSKLEAAEFGLEIVT